MQDKKKLEIDIELKDLFWEILKNWRIMLCCMLAGGIMMGALSYLQSYQAAHAKQTVLPPAKTAEEVMEELNIDEYERVIAAVQLKAQIDAKSQYIKESTLMQINPFAKDTVLLEYLVEGEDILRALESYQNFIEQGDFLEENERDLVEITCEKDAHMLVIRMTEKDAAACAELANKVKDGFAEYKNTLKNRGVMHECILISENQSTIVDEDLHTYQDTYLKACIEDQDKLKKMKSEMNGNQIKVYLHLERDIFDRGQEKEETGEESGNTTQAVVPAKASGSIKKVALGMILGAVLSVLFIVIRYLFCGTIRVPAEVEALYGVPLLGVVSEPEKKRFLSVIDKAIWKFEYRKENRKSVEEELKHTAASIAILCKKYEIDKIYVSGSSIAKMNTNLFEELKRELQGYNIEVQVGGDVAEDAKSLLAASEIGSMLLVEKRREASYKNILRCVQTCHTNHIRFIGAMIVEKRA